MKVGNVKFKERSIPVGVYILKVNERPVKTVSELNDIVKEASKSKSPVLYIQGMYPSGKKDYFTVPLED